MKGTAHWHGTCLPCGKPWVQFPTCPFPPKLDYLIIILISLKMMYRPLTACPRDDHTICPTHDSALPLARFKVLGAPCQRVYTARFSNGKVVQQLFGIHCGFTRFLLIYYALTYSASVCVAILAHHRGRILLLQV